LRWSPISAWASAAASGSGWALPRLSHVPWSSLPGEWYEEPMPGRALVLGGGGVTGVAWELGLLAGLAELGVDLTDADLVVGTSAGSVVGADVTSGISLAEFYAAQLAPSDSEIADRIGLRWIAGLIWIMARSRDPAKARARIGRMALSAKTVSEAERRKVIAARLLVHEWPARRLLITAVDAGSGEFRAFDAVSGVTLVDAVGASCAVPGIWPSVTIGGRRYMDGGMRSPANVDLAAGHERIVVVAPLARGFGHLTSVAKQVADLGGSPQVAVLEPDQAALKAIGRNVLDPARRVPAARAGHSQAATVAKRVAAVWSGAAAAPRAGPAAPADPAAPIA
jgi:NTE family protein